jgi:hypothetical protein
MDEQMARRRGIVKSAAAAHYMVDLFSKSQSLHLSGFDVAQFLFLHSLLRRFCFKVLVGILARASDPNRQVGLFCARSALQQLLAIISTASQFDGKALFSQLAQQPLPMIALNFDSAVFDRAAAAQFLLESARHLLQLLHVRGQTGNDGHALAFAALGLKRQADNSVAARNRRHRLFFAEASIRRLPAIWAQVAQCGGINPC